MTKIERVQSPIVDIPGQPTPGGDQPAPDAGLSPKALFAALRRRWFPCVLLGSIAAAVLAVPAWFIAPAPYTTHSEVHVKTELDVVLPGTKDPRESFNIFKQNQIKYIKSDYVLNAALREIGDLETIRAQPHPREWLENELDVKSEGAEFLLIEMSGENAEELAQIVNAVTYAYLEEVDEREGGRRRGRIEKLEAVRARLHTEKKQASDELRRLSERAGATTVKESESKQQALLAAATAVRSQYTTMYVDLLRKRIELQARSVPEEIEDPGEVERSELPKGLVDGYLAQVPRYSEALQKAQAAESYVDALRDAVVEDSPRLQQARARLDSLEATREKLYAEMAPRVEEELRLRLQEKVTEPTVQLEREVELLEAQVQGFEAQMTGFEVEAEKSQSHTFELREQTKKLEDAEAFYAQVDQELQRLEIERETTSGVSLFAEARPPMQRDKAAKIKFAGLGGLGGFGLVAFALMYFEIRKSRVSSLDELLPLGIPILGSWPIVPRSASKGGRHDKRSKYWFDILTESVDSTRAVFLQQSRHNDVRTVLVASAMSGEGKTTVACHICASLARTGRNVLLVDCDLRCPSVGDVFEIEQSPGLSEFLMGQCELEDAICASGHANLSILPAGVASRRAIDTLSTENRVVPFIERLRNAYDVVVFDSPPLLTVTEGLVLAHQVDGVLVAARRDVTQMHLIRGACERLSLVGANVLGAVVMGLEASRQPSYYYRYGNLSNTENVELVEGAIPQ